MPGVSVSINSLLVLLTGLTALGQVPDYFPLNVGNVWIYRTRGVPPRPGTDRTIVEVTTQRNFNDVTYYQLTGYRNGAFWLRNDGAGRVLQFDEATGAEKLWYDFTLDEYATALPTCCGRARVVSRNASKKVALGQFDKAFLQLTYPGVFQVGITEEDFLPYIGLVYRTENTGGPSFREEDLEYAKIAGVTVLNASGLGFGLARARDYARIFVNNNTGAPLRLIFPSGQTFELLIHDAEGKVLYRWSDGKAFTLAIRSVDLAPGETSWPVALPQLPGAASISAELVTAGPRFAASIHW